MNVYTKEEYGAGAYVLKNGKQIANFHNHLDAEEYIKMKQKQEGIRTVTIQVADEISIIEIITQIYKHWECSVNGRWIKTDPIYYSSLIREKK